MIGRMNHRTSEIRVLSIDSPNEKGMGHEPKRMCAEEKAKGL